MTQKGKAERPFRLSTAHLSTAPRNARAELHDGTLYRRVVDEPTKHRGRFTGWHHLGLPLLNDSQMASIGTVFLWWEVPV